MIEDIFPNSQSGDTQGQGSNSATILVIDDFEFDRNQLQEYLGSSGFEVLAVETGEEGLALLAERPVDLVVLDSDLPGMNGPEILSLIRERFTPLDLPVIMVTVFDQSQAVIRGLGLGANDYIAKPLAMDVLEARLRTHLSIRELRNALDREQRFSHALVESAHDMILAVRGDGRIARINKKAAELLSTEQSKILGRHGSELFQHTPAFQQILEGVGQEGSFCGDVDLLRADGTPFTAHVTASALRDSDGQSDGIVIIIRDVHDQRQLEREHARLLETKEDFLTLASHDLKNPIGTILGHAWLLNADNVAKEDGSSDETTESLEIIRQTAEHMQNIVHSFLDFHAIEGGHLTLQNEPVAIPSLARSVVNSNREYARGKDLQLELIAESEDLIVMGDGERLRQVIRNLVDNAIKFAGPGCSVTVRVESREDSVELLVTDTGPGLNDEDFATVFQKYASLSNKPTGGEGSSSLGLFICRQMINLHGGEIGVYNNESGVGATFWFRLPAHRAA